MEFLYVPSVFRLLLTKDKRNKLLLDSYLPVVSNKPHSTL